MGEKKAKSASSSKKRKQVFDPFARVGVCTAPLPAPNSAPAPPTVFPAEFIDTVLTISPPLPKSEVMLTVQFRCTVDLVPGDALTLHLPGFKGPSPRVVSLETLPHPDGLNSARCFAAYWAGDAKPKKSKGVVGVPSKQTIVLRCLRRIEENSLVIFAVPLALGLVAPDKLAPNSAKIKLEGNAVRSAEGGKIGKQAFLSCTGVKKVAVVEELETYEQAMTALVESSGLGKDDRLVAEELLYEDVEQMVLAVATMLPLSSSSAPAASVASSSQLPCRQRPYPVSMPWPVAPRLFHAYEDAGAFVKAVMENAIAFIKRHDHLAVHREVAANWGVKVGAVVVLEDMLAVRYASLYPSVSRTALLVAHLLTMEPVDVAKTFPTTRLPPYSIQQELLSAFRMQHTLATVDSAGAACGAPGRCEAVLQKWAAVVSVLLTATMPVSTDAAADSEDDGSNNKGQQSRVRFATPARPGSGAGSTGDGDSPPPVLLMPPPPLFTGVREVPADELQHLRELQEGDWYVFPNFTVAQQYCPVPSLSAPDPSTTAVAATVRFSVAATTAVGAHGAQQPAATGGEGDESNEAGGGDDASVIPDNAVLFEIRRTVEALELADVSLYPYSRQWLLPFSSSFRVVSVTTHDDLNDLTHVVLDMVGSLTGEVADVENVPEGDRAVARMVVRKLRMEAENSESRSPGIARLAYENVKRNDRRRLHPPTLMRAQYLSHYQDVKRASEAMETVESGLVQWQVRVHPAQILEEGVVKPAVWEPLPKKYAPAVEQFFLSRTRTKYLLEDNGIVADFAKFTADYAGKGPRPIRRLVDKRITHEPGLEEGVLVYEQTKELIQAASVQIASLNVKLGLAPTGQPLNASATAATTSGGSTKSKKTAAESKQPQAAAVKAA